VESVIYDRDELKELDDPKLAAAAYQEAREGQQGEAFDVMVKRQKSLHDRLFRMKRDDYSQFSRDALRTRAVLLLHTTTMAIEMADEHAEENNDE
jgi:hypothetical protein